MQYKFIEHTADIAVEVSANTIEDLFKVSCSAWRAAVLENINSFSIEEKEITLDAGSLEELLVCFLNELNFYLYAEQWIFNSVSSLKITNEKKFVRLDAKVAGEPFNKSIHHLKEEIKAVTYHQVKIQNNGDNFFTRIVFDI
jgi:SHS2 domain-containing protein